MSNKTTSDLLQLVSNPLARIPIEERFLNYCAPVNVDGCVIWTGARYRCGYGKFSVGHSQYKPAHRVAWAIFIRQDPGERFVCHKCDIKLCVNPQHHFLGTRDDNTADAVLKHRFSHGEKHYCATLSEADVITIRTLVANGVNGYEIARRYGIHPVTAYKIIRRELWAHVQA